jgi:hypothetical protein
VSSSASDQNDSESDNTVDDVGYCNNAEWVVTRHKRNIFPAKYNAGRKGELKDKKTPEEIYKHFLHKQDMSAHCATNKYLCTTKNK